MKPSDLDSMFSCLSHFQATMRLASLPSFAIRLPRAVIQGRLRHQNRTEGWTLQGAQAWVGLGFKVGVSS